MNADPSLSPALDFYNEYVWSSKGGTQETKNTNTTSYTEKLTTSSWHSNVFKLAFNAKLTIWGVKAVGLDIGYQNYSKDTHTYSFSSTGETTFDVAASFDGIDGDTQMRYTSNNDAHFVMNNNSAFNPNNQSGLNLVIGSDGLVYNVAPSVNGGSGLPTSDNVDDADAYIQPPPVYSAGNASGPSGDLLPYDRPGKTSLFRSYAFFQQPSQDNSDNFWNTVVDPLWMQNSTETGAQALYAIVQAGTQSSSIPWRLSYRVTYSERFLPPITSGIAATPEISPIVAVPVKNPVTDFIYQPPNIQPRPALNPGNDIAANVVLVAPTATGQFIGTIATSGTSIGNPIQPNNMIPFDIVQNAYSIVSWGDRSNKSLIGTLLKSILGLNTISFAGTVPPGSTKVYDVLNPAKGGILYSEYVDPNGLGIFVLASGLGSVTVYADINNNPVQFFDGDQYWSLQDDYIGSGDNTMMYYIQPPSSYDQTTFSLVGDYDLYGNPGDQWRYYLVSGTSANMTSDANVTSAVPFFSSGLFTGFSQPASHSDPSTNAKLVNGYVLAQTSLQWPNLNTNSETVADVLVYKAMSLLDTFPIGDIDVLINFLTAQYPEAEWVANENDQIAMVFARNIISYFNSTQTALLPR